MSWEGGSCCCTCSLVKSSREMDRQKTDAGFQKLGREGKQLVRVFYEVLAGTGREGKQVREK